MSNPTRNDKLSEDIKLLQDRLKRQYDYTSELNTNLQQSIKKVQEDIDELSYYIQEDAFNGNLDSTVVQIYIDKIDELNKELMYISSYGCENCDEID